MNTTFALFTKDAKAQTLELAAQIITYLQKQNVEVIAEPPIAEALNVSVLTSENALRLKCVLSLGGDGTILRFHRKFPDCIAPIIGINLGSLGFLADIPLSSCFESLDKLLAGQYRVAHRMVLEGALRNGVMTAVNEFSVHRSSTPFLIDLSIHVDGRYFNTFSADGVLVSTPLGSTAYSLAAGGPIIDPDVQAIVITPICPHAISTKPVVVMPKEQITISCTTPGARAEVIYDGIVGPILSTEDTLTVSISENTFNMIRLDNSDFFSTVRSKLGWTGSLRK
jgi:NAD+ kinase